MTTQGELSGGGTRKRKDPRYYSEPRTHVRHPDDFYVEPWWVIDMLLDAEDFESGTRVVADPCCGTGTAVRRCRARGIEAYGSDLRDRGLGFPTYDFLGDGTDQLFSADWGALFPRRPTDIIMNVPFKGLAPRKFIERARDEVTGKVAVIVQAKFLFSATRWAWFTKSPPSTVYICSTRPSMPPGDKFMKGLVVAEGGKMDYCILVYDPMHIGAATVHWLKSRYSSKDRRKEPA